VNFSSVIFFRCNFFFSAKRNFALYLQKDVHLIDQWIWNGKHYSKTLEAWLEKTDINIDKVKAIFDKNYGDEADKQLFNWRLFFIFCSEVFGYNGGNEWHVALFLFKKQIGSSL
jgi:cyclopropane fatty-acyl-phospholipid synthase-like methyltransferase